jgi:hypothetical protein
MESNGVAPTRPMMRPVLPLLVLLATSTGGCGLGLDMMKPAPQPLVVAPGSEGNERLPYTLHVLAERREGETLRVQGELLVREVLPPTIPTAISLTTFREGMEVTTTRLGLSELLRAAPGGPKQRLTAGDRLPFSFDVSAAGASDYQLDLVWGDEARDLVAQTAPAATAPRASASLPPAPPPFAQEPNAQPNRDVILADVRTEKIPTGCTPTGCTFTFRLSGRIRNVGGAPVTGVRLGVGFMLAGRDQGPPEAEETLDVTGLRLEPGEDKPFRVNIERAVTLDQAARVVPSVRVLGIQ